MILVLGGTLEGREISCALAGKGYDVTVTVVSDYGAEMISPDIPVKVLVGSLDRRELDRILDELRVDMIVDATHPYAGLITETAWQTACDGHIPYIRYERPETLAEAAGRQEPAGFAIYRTASYREAAELAVSLGNTVFLTIGSRNLATFSEACRKSGTRAVARVLPDLNSIEQCAALGIPAGDIIAVQGPFSVQMNIAMFKEHRARVLVTKDSGRAGGTDTKLEAARELGIPVVVVSRPTVAGVPVKHNIDEIMAAVEDLPVNKSLKTRGEKS